MSIHPGTKFLTLEYEGLILEVEGYYTPEEHPSYDSPGEPEYFEFNSIKIEGLDTDMLSLFSDEVIGDIHKLCLKDIHEPEYNGEDYDFTF